MSVKITLSNHELKEAVKCYCNKQGITTSEADEVDILVGRGANETRAEIELNPDMLKPITSPTKRTKVSNFVPIKHAKS